MFNGEGTPNSTDVLRGLGRITGGQVIGTTPEGFESLMNQAAENVVRRNEAGKVRPVSNDNKAEQPRPRRW